MIETRAKRLGVYGKCPRCDGEGELWNSPEVKRLADEWEREEPPEGDGWQLWQTVSDGPISPVFSTADELIDWMCQPCTERKMLGAVERAQRGDTFRDGPAWRKSTRQEGSCQNQ